MEISRKEIITRFPWINKIDQYFIISADYDGLICASFLHHHLNWKLVGYYNLENLWLSNTAVDNRSDLIWVDLNILPEQGKTIGGHIVSINGEIPKGFSTSCNPNLLLKLTAEKFDKKFPFSTILFLMWIHNVYPPNELIAKLLVLHADAVWLKFQHYPDNITYWKTILSDFNWDQIYKGVNTKTYEKRVDNLLYSKLEEVCAVSGKSKLSSIHTNLKSREYQCNPDWDEDVILKLFSLFGNYLHWTPPSIPEISQTITGKRIKIPLSQIKKLGLNKFLSGNKVFSYAIPSSNTFNYTTFEPKKNVAN